MHSVFQIEKLILLNSALLLLFQQTKIMETNKYQKTEEKKTEIFENTPLVFAEFDLLNIHNAPIT